MAKQIPSIQSIRQILGTYSIAAVRNWLKRLELQHTMSSRDAMLSRIHKLLESGGLTEQQLIEGAIGIEESSSKRTFLYRVPNSPSDLAVIDKQLHDLDIKLSSSRLLSTSPAMTPKLVYAMSTPSIFRAKWNEQHIRITADKRHKTFEETKEPKVIVLIVDKKTGIVQLRYDKPDDRHSHTAGDEPSSDVYFSDYVSSAENLLGLALERIDFRKGLEKVLKAEPRIVSTNYTVDDAEDGALTKRTQKKAGKDIRDTSEWKRIASDKIIRTFEEAPLYWLPEMSSGKLKRELFSYVDAANGFVRFDADCYEDEIDYAIAHLV